MCDVSIQVYARPYILLQLTCIMDGDILNMKNPMSMNNYEKCKKCAKFTGFFKLLQISVLICVNL